LKSPHTHHELNHHQERAACELAWKTLTIMNQITTKEGLTVNWLGKPATITNQAGCELA
jgi:hypothetical protein